MKMAKETYDRTVAVLAGGAAEERFVKKF